MPFPDPVPIWTQSHFAVDCQPQVANAFIGDIKGAFLEADVRQKALANPGFVRSKFDNCLYLCYDHHNRLEGVLGAHVDDTITGGSRETYAKAIDRLRSLSFQEVEVRNT